MQYELLFKIKVTKKRTLAFFSFFSDFDIVMAANRCCVRTATVWLQRAAIVARSAPMIPR
jgi:hypothetical protein